MAGYDLGPRISLKGENEFNQAIKRSNDSLKEYRSAINALDADMKANGESIEKLREKHNLLQKLMEAQNSKISTYELKLAELTQTMNKQGYEVQQLTNSRNQAKAQLDALQQSETATSEEIKNATANLLNHEKQLAKAKNEYTQTEGNVSKFTVAINETRANVSKLSTELNTNDARMAELKSGASQASRGLDDIEKSAKEADGTLKDLAKTASKQLFQDALDGASALADKLKDLSRGARDSLESLDSAAAKANAFLGVSDPAQIKETKELLKQFQAKGIADGYEDAADALTEITSATKNLPELATQLNAGEMTEQALLMRNVFDIDLNEGIRGVNALVNQFGLTAQEAFDLMASGASAGLNKSGELADNVAEYSANFAEAGYSAQEMFQIMDNGFEGGAYNADKINDSIREAGIRLNDGTIEEGLDSWSSHTQEMFNLWQVGFATQSDVINSMIQDINKAETEQEKATLAAQLFGTAAEDGGYKFASSLSSAGDSFENFSGTMAQASDTMTTPWTELNQTIEESKQKFSDIMGAEISQNVQDIAGIVNTIMEALDGAPDWVKDLAGRIITYLPMIVGGLVAINTTINSISGLNSTLKPITKLIGTNLSSGVSKLTKNLLPKLGTSFSSLGTILMAHPIFLVVGIIAGIITALVVLYNKCEWFRNIVDAGVQEVVDFITKTIPETIDNIIQWFTDLPGNIAEAFNSFVLAIGEWGFNILNTIIEAIGNWGSSIIQFWEELPGKIWDFLVNLVQLIINWGSDSEEEAGKSSDNTILKIISNFLNLPTKLWQVLLDVLAQIAKWGLQMLGMSEEEADDTVNGIINTFKNLPQNVWNWLLGVIDNIGRWGGEMFSKAKQGVDMTINGIKKWFSELPGKAIEWGSDMIQGFINGIKKMISGVTDAIRGVADKVAELLHFSKPDKGPLREYEKWMPDMLKGMAKGVRQNRGILISEIEKLATDMDISNKLNYRQTVNSNQRIVIEPKVYMGRKEIARGVAEELNLNSRGRIVAQGG